MAATREQRWHQLANAQPRSLPLPDDAGGFTQWRARVRAAVGLLAGPGPDGPAQVIRVGATAADGLRWEEYVVTRAGAGEFRMILTMLDAAGHRGPAVVVCPGRHAVIDQVTGRSGPGGKFSLIAPALPSATDVDTYVLYLRRLGYLPVSRMITLVPDRAKLPHVACSEYNA